jgi:hypothetical protein
MSEIQRWSPSNEGTFEYSDGRYVLYTDHLAAIAEKEKQIAILDRFQSLCHCGVLAKDHVFHDGHSPVPMIEPCPNGDALLEIHKILLCPAECPPIAETDGWEVKALKCIIQDWHRAVKHNAMLRNRT